MLTTELFTLTSNLEMNSNHRRMCKSLLRDLEIILDRGAKNLVQFNASMSQSSSMTIKTCQNTHSVVINGLVLENRESFSLIGVNIEYNKLVNTFVPLIYTPLMFLK